jgi:MFS family permease
MLITTSGVVSAFKILGVVFLGIICGCSLFVTTCPGDFVPAGWRPPEKPLAGSGKDSGDKNWKQMLADPIFYVMLFMLMSGGVFGLMIISQTSSLAQNITGMSVAAAASVVSVLALFNAIGRICAGYLSDKFGRVNTLSIMLVMAIGGLGLLNFCNTGDIIMFYIGISIVGLCFGAFMGIYPGFTADQFGQKHSGTNYSIMFTGFGLSAFLWPMIITHIFNSSGSYTGAFIVASALALFGIILSFILRNMLKTNMGKSLIYQH